MAKKGSAKISVKDYEKLGRTLENIFEGGYINHWRVYKINLVRGLFFGFGSVVGGTIIIGLLFWILSFFAEIPIIGGLAETIRSSIEQ